MPDPQGVVALVEDDPIMGESLQRAFELEGWRAVWWRTGAQALVCLGPQAPDLVLCDIRLPDMSGEDIFRVANRRPGAPPFIFMTAFGQINQAVALIRAGAQDYVTKPFDLDTLFQKTRAILTLSVRSPGAATLGMSAAMMQIESLLLRLASRSLPVLLTGETGVGKEVCARFLHRRSAGPDEPFMAVNCAAIPSELLESEVFGHERGAFSGAHQRHLGYAERARAGILFLDEIGAMPLALQSKLLRMLDQRSFHRVGGEAAIALKARIVCATCDDLEERVARGLFREDLLYRINAVTVRIPPLRERADDIAWLLSHYFNQFASGGDVELRGVSSLAEEMAIAHAWRGNVRELRNRVERAVNLASGPWIMPNDLFPDLCRDQIAQAGDDLPLSAVRDAAEKRRIVGALQETGGQVLAAARRLGVSRTTLWEKMRRHAINLDDARK